MQAGIGPLFRAAAARERHPQQLVTSHHVG
jgi:hypothetical protein